MSTKIKYKVALVTQQKMVIPKSIQSEHCMKYMEYKKEPWYPGLHIILNINSGTSKQIPRKFAQI